MTKRIIDEIKKTKKGITVKISAKEYLLSAKDYTDFYFYPGKVLFDSEFNEIEKASKSKKISDYLTVMM